MLAAVTAGSRHPTVVCGSIITMDRDCPRAQAMAIVNGRVVAVGSVQGARDAAGAGVREVAFSEGAVIPGLIDTHKHMHWTGIQLRIVDLARCTSIAGIQAAIRGYAAKNPGARWIVSGSGWHVANLKEQRYPTRQELDAACADRPVYLPRGGHAAVANTAALRIAGIGRDTPDPPGGKIERDPVSGEPTGLLLEPPAFEPMGRLAPSLSRDEQIEAMREIQKRYHAAGITGIMDPGVTPEIMAIYQDLWACGELVHSLSQ